MSAVRLYHIRGQRRRPNGALEVMATSWWGRDAASAIARFCALDCGATPWESHQLTAGPADDSPISPAGSGLLQSNGEMPALSVGVQLS